MNSLQRNPGRRSAGFYAHLASLSTLALLLTILQSQVRASDENVLNAEAVYQGAQASDAFSAIHYLGNGRIIAGKRSSQASNRFLLSQDYGATWQVVACPNSTGAHTYFFGQNGSTVFSGTGDTGSPCLMKSTDTGSTWTVALTATQINTLVGSAGGAKSVFSPVYLGDNRWIVNIKSFDTRKKVIYSIDNGANWFVPTAQPGQDVSAWARQMILTTDNVLLWPSCLTDMMYMSTDLGVSWTSVTVPGASLFQPLCDAGNGVYFCGEVTTAANTPIRLYRSLDHGLSWAQVASVNLQRPSITYWRDVIRVGYSLLASACCVEASSTDRNMQLFLSVDDGTTWYSLGNPYMGPYGGMQAIYQMCVTESNVVFAGCQPDSTILKWSMPVGYTLNLSTVNAPFGQVEVTPNLPRYPPGAAVTLTATPNPGRGFRHYEIYDPNFPDDANKAAIDPNATVTILMNADRRIAPVFTCGTGLEACTLAPLLIAITVSGLLRHRMRRRPSQPR